MNASRTVLVVDDDADIRNAMVDAIEDEGHTTAAAVDGTDALEYLESHPPPALILLDWNMTPMNAPEFMKRFSNLETASRVPVVLITADARAEDKAKTTGIARWLKKPVNLDTLLAIVEEHVR
jgi:two-component system chemotaxis response regulator CheY